MTEPYRKDKPMTTKSNKPLYPPCPWDYRFTESFRDPSTEDCEILDAQGDGVLRFAGNRHRCTQRVRLITASVNAFDSAAKALGVNAVELAERMADGGIAELVEALDALRNEIFGDQDEILLGPGPKRDAIKNATLILAKVRGFPKYDSQPQIDAALARVKP